MLGFVANMFDMSADAMGWAITILLAIGLVAVAATTVTRLLRR
jgi:hypothetical protein